jgi:hypothetical protein
VLAGVYAFVASFFLTGEKDSSSRRPSFGVEIGLARAQPFRGECHRRIFVVQSRPIRVKSLRERNLVEWSLSPE